MSPQPIDQAAAERFLYGDEPEVQQRISALAVSSLVFSLVCCLPGTGLIGAGLGTGAIYAIGKSERRLGGNGLALVGIVLGLLSTMVWVGLLIGGAQMLRSMDRNITQPTAAFFRAVEGSDFAAARAAFTQGAGAATGDDAFERFRRELADTLGAFRQAENPDIGELITTFRSGGTGGAANAPGASRELRLPGDQFPLPLPQVFRFEKGPAVVMWIMDDPAALYTLFFGNQSIEGRSVNLVVWGPQGREIWLRPPPQAPAPGTLAPAPTAAGTGPEAPKPIVPSPGAPGPSPGADPPPPPPAQPSPPSKPGT
ncbi:MAG: DUF4190 domain-containing protein [Phycisphaerae bacterium]|nr:DUF4190 domain-containing protein [Phycisphaerae bacterium]